MKTLILAVILSIFFTGTVFAVTQNTLTPEEISGIQSEVAECPKDEIGKVTSVAMKPGQPASKKDNIEWTFKVQLANNKIINSPTYQPKGKSPSRYIGQTICTKEHG